VFCALVSYVYNFSIHITQLVRYYNYYFAPGRSAKRCDQRVCLSVCPLGARIAEKPLAQTSRNSLFLLPVTVAWSCSDDNGICYILPVLWMTSRFHMANTDTAIQAIGKLFTVTRQVVPKAKSATVDCLVLIFVSSCYIQFPRRGPKHLYNFEVIL